MKLSRLIINLTLVAVLGFLNAFMVQNYGQRDQAGEADGVFQELKPEVVILEMTESSNFTEFNL